MTRTGRRSRSAIAAIFTALLAVGAHVAGHGEPPPLLALLLVTGLIWVVAHTVAARRLSGWQILILLGAAQFGIHELSTYLAVGTHHAASLIDPVWMTSTHIISTLVTALLLARGEQLWWYLTAWIDRRKPVVQPAPASEHGFERWVPAAASKFVSRICTTTVGLRAPPAAARS